MKIKGDWSVLVNHPYPAFTEYEQMLMGQAGLAIQVGFDSKGRVTHTVIDLRKRLRT